MSSDLSVIIEKYQELQQLHQLNLELLEQLNIACGYFVDNNIPLPNLKTLYSLFQKAQSILNEIQADTPKILQYNKLSDDWKHRDKSNGKVTEPCFIRLLYWVMSSWLLQEIH